MQRSIPRYDNTPIISSPTIKSRTDHIGTSLSLNPYRQEVLGAVSNELYDMSYPYRVCVINSINSDIITLHLSPYTVYSLTMESICCTDAYAAKIYYEILIQCTDNIDTKIIHSSKHSIANHPIDISIQITCIDDMCIRIHSSTISRWTSRISILRSALLTNV